MTDNTITITLDDVLGPDGLDGAWEGMISKLADKVDSKFLHSDIGKSFHKVCIEAINKAVQEKIEERLQVIMANPIQLTDNYGQPKGDPTTFNAMIGDAVDASMTSKVDYQGQFRRDGQQTLFEHALRNVARAGLKEAVIDEVRKVNVEAKAAVAKEVANAINKVLKA